ncbi:ROK family transcriptional regulator [Corynebacterium cystitidis]|uniref:ROK family transcriptional regulator n=1 Tax=Corynebacterium cystitidis TaxID=35757 RepID=UPI00211EB673|nr:ROK family transcriptional regulator [Corynebacterium cystitidis]
MRPTDLRTHNLARLIRLIAEGFEPLSRASLAKSAQLTKPTVSKLVDELVAGGLVTEGAPEHDGRSGRPFTPLTISQGSHFGIATSFSADHLGIRLQDLAGNVAHETYDYFPLRDVDSTLPRVISLLQSALAHLPKGATVVGFIASIPGRIDSQEKYIISAPNLDWDDIPLGELIDSAVAREIALPLPPVRLVNDARVVTATELAERPGQSFVVLYGETGIGGTIVLDGKILGGSKGWAGEIGHTIVDPNGPQCRCGNHGCLEAYASYWALCKRASLPNDIPISALPEHLPPEVLEEVGYWIGVAVSNVLTFLDIHTVVFAGYLSTFYSYVKESIKETIAQRTLDFSHRSIEMHPLKVNEDALLLGGCIEALKPVFEQPNLWINGA